MEILVDRIECDGKATLSRVSVDGQFVCYGLEDEYREKKVDGETRIPAGTYRVKPRKEGGFHERYKVDFADMHRGMLHVQDVPNFKWILIHVGNFEKNTAGCLLVGTGRGKDENGTLMVQSSKLAYEKLYPMVIGAAEAGDLIIKYVDSDRGAVA